MRSRHVRRVYAIVTAMMIILSPLTSLFPWKGMETVIGESGENSLTPITTITGPDEGDRFGWNVSWVGDVNGDGFDDIIAGAPYADIYSGGDWWDTGWSFRKKLIFDNSGQSEDLVNFPVLVNLSSSNFDYSKAKLDGSDLRFIDDDGTTELNYEIESWNSSGKSLIWVNVTNIVASSNTDFMWLYYGNSIANDESNPEGVWDSNYVGVWHLIETGDGTPDEYEDSTFYPNDGRGGGGNLTRVPTMITGKIDGSQDFDGVDDYIICDQDSSIANIFNNGGTISAWIYPEGFGGFNFGRILDKSSATAGDNGWVMCVDGTGSPSDHLLFYRGFNINRGLWYTPQSSINLDQWQHVLVVYNESSDLNDPTIFINGIEQSITEDVGATPSGIASNDAAQSLYIGNFMDGGRTFNGAIDEIRISNIARSTDWVRAQYLSLNNSFLTYGSEETKDWWDTGWSYRKKLTFDNSGQSEDLVNFPVMVNLSSSNFDYSKAKLNGTDLRFIDEDGVTELKYHIEDWNFLGSSYVWVNVTNIASGSSSDHIWMYYGNSGALDVQDEEGTYDRNFIMVQHLHETSKISGTYNDHHDSTSNDNDGEAEMDEANMDTIGRIDGADDFDGTDDYIDCGNDASLNIGNAVGFSITAWIYPKELDDSQFWDNVLFSKLQDTNNRFYFRLRNEEQMQFHSVIGGNVYTAWGILDTGYDFTKDSWYMISWIIDRTEGANGVLKVYHNENLAGTFSFDQDISGVDFSSTGDGWIGAHSDYGTPQWLFNGIIDEVQISNTARSADWVKAQYISQNNSYIIYGDEETLSEDCGAAYIFFGRPGITTSNINAANANVTIFGSNAGDLFGWSVSDAGDMNNDGYDDVIIGAPGSDEVNNFKYVWNSTDVKVNQNIDNANQFRPIIVTDLNENEIVVWFDDREDHYNIYAQKIDPNGNILWGSTDKIVNQNSDVAHQMYPAVALDSSGNAIVVWMDNRSGDWDIYAQKLDSDGNALWGSSDKKVNQNPDGAGQTNPDVALDSSGNAIVVWEDNRTSDWDIHAQKLDPNGNVQWGSSDKKVNQNSDSTDQVNPAVAVSSNGNAVVVWDDERNGVSDKDIYGQKLNSIGDAQWGSSDKKVNQNSDTEDQIVPDVALDLSGNAIVVWYDYRNSNWDIYAQKLYTDGNTQWGSSDKKVNQNSDSSDQQSPVVAVDSRGNAVIVWYDYRDGNWDIYAQRLNTDGNTEWEPSDKKINQNSDNVDQYYPGVTIDSSGNAIVVWEDSRNIKYDIYAQKIDFFASDIGRAYIFYGRATSSWNNVYDADTDADVILTGEDEGDRFGFSVSCAGELNSITSTRNFYEDCFYRKKIIINASQVMEDLIDFPVLISITDSDLKSKARLDGYDIIFTKSNGRTILDYEIERYNSSSGELVAWVRIPNLSSSTDNIIYMYYGNNDQSLPTENPDGVWDSDYLGVWHLTETGDGSPDEFKDSSIYDNHGQGGEGDSLYVPTCVPGKIGYGQDFNNMDGKYDLIDCGDSPIFDITGNQITLEAWIQHNITPQDHPYGILNHKGWFDGYSLFIRRNSIKIGFNLPGETHQLTSAGDVSNNSWHHIVATYDGAWMRIYIDGAQDPNILEKTDNIKPSTFQKDMWIGHGDQPQDENWSGEWEGQIDEVRISNIARSTAWITTQFNNQNNSSKFCSVGDEEINAINWLYRKRITVNASQVMGNLIDFPMLIDMKDTDLKNKAHTDGYDIVFTGLDGRTRLDHEIESYDSSSGELIAWIKIPYLYSSTDSGIYMYYGNSLVCSPIENPTGVWDADYIGVWHLAEEGTGTRYDSTKNNNDGTPTNYDGDEAVVGWIGRADKFDGINDYITTSNGNSIKGQTQVTVEAWFNMAYHDGNSQKIYAETRNTDGSIRLEVTISAGSDLGFGGRAPDTDSYTAWVGGLSVSTNNWYHFVAVFDSISDTHHIYLNGVDYSNSVSEPAFDNTDPAGIPKIGALTEAASSKFNGTIDELRLSYGVRNADWVQTEYNNQNSTSRFYNVGNEEIIPTNWLYRKPITINSSRVTGNLTDYPMLINILDSDLKNKARPDGNDIIFTESDGRTRLDHEIESYNSSFGELIAWVRIPYLSASVSAPIFMYYGNDNAYVQSNPESVWDVNYSAVWHLDEKPSDGNPGGHEDSTANNNDGTSQNFQDAGGGSTDASGKIDGADEFASDDDYITIPSPTNTDPINKLTVSAWIKADYSISHHGDILSRGDSYVLRVWTSGRILFSKYDGSGWVNLAPLDVDVFDDKFHQIVGVQNETGMFLYIDGVLNDSNGNTDSIAYTLGNTLEIGRHGNDNPGYNYSGIIDEARVSNVARSADWIATEFNNQYDTSSFYTVGDEESFPQNWFYRKAITINASKITGDLTNFPILIDTIDPDLKNKARADGYDVLFTEEDGRTRLDHEVESYNSSTGELVAWVKVPFISSSADTTIYMHYGNSAQNFPTENPEGVWDDHYNAIWHLSEIALGIPGDYKDSTSNSYDGEGGSGTPWRIPARTTGKIGYGQNFDGINDIINCSSMNPMVYNDFTFEAWYKSSDNIPEKDEYIFAHRITNPNGPGVVFSVTEDVGEEGHLRLYIYNMTADFEAYYGTTNLTDMEFHHLVGVRENGIIRLYVDGVLENVLLDQHPKETIIINSLNSPVIGDFPSSAEEVNGTLDEIRVSRVARSWDWINASYSNQNDSITFCSIGPEEINPDCWLYRKRITINSSKVAGNLTDFPILIHIKDADLKNKARLDGYDIIFTEFNGRARLDHEIECYNGTSGELFAWVRIPYLSSTSNTNIYMYYGKNNQNVTMENADGVWDNNYSMVQHLNETSGTHYDSTRYKNDGTEYIDTPGSQDATGKIDGADDFDGSNDYIQISDNLSLDISLNITVEMWLNPKALNDRVLLYKYEAYAMEIWFDGSFGGVIFRPAGGTETVGSGTDTMATGTWNHIVFSYNKTSQYMLLYLNGKEVGSRSYSGDIRISGNDLFICSDDTPTNFFNGTVDEVRISKVARSADWVITEYNNQNDTSTFYTIGSEEQNGEGQTDNYDDVIVGACGYGNDQGRAYIFFGENGFIGEISAGNADMIINGTNPNDRLGWDVSRAGDVNKDGVEDMIIGAPGNNNNTGAVYIFHGNYTVPSIVDASNADVILVGESVDDEFGYSVSYAMDVNNDGFDDVIVGAPGYNSDQGRAYIFCGMGYNDMVIANEMDDTVTIYNGTSNNDWETKSTLVVGPWTYSVFVGDANNDGYNDILTADYMDDTVTVYNGTLFGVWEQKSILDVGDGPMSVFVGDANNDGYNDIVATNYEDNTVTISNGTGDGEWEVKSALNVGTNPRSVFVGDANNDGYNDIVIADFTDHTVIIYNGTDYGWEDNYTLDVGTNPLSVFVGDANNDGYNDILTADYMGETVTIYNGTSSGGWEPKGNLSVGAWPDSVFVGDANNDGYNDIITSDQFDNTVTVYNGTSGYSWEEKCTLEVGINPRSVFVGDANNDGYNDILTADWSDNKITIYNGTSSGDWAAKGNLSVGVGPYWIFVGNVNNDRSLMLTGESTGDRFGLSVSYAGDIDEDGFPDVVVGAPFYDDGSNSDAGAVYVFGGGHSMNNTSDWVYKGEHTGDNFGWSVSSGGDVNDDGLMDIIVGAPDNDEGGVNAGKVYVLSITTPKPVITDIMATPSVQFIGGFVNITCNVIASIGVGGVWVNVTDPDGGYSNVSMTQGIGYMWFNNTVYTIPGLYQYIIWANDTGGNWTVSDIFQFEIINRPPSLSFSQVNPAIGNMYTGFNFTVIYTDMDNHTPSNITVNITGVGVYDLLELDPIDSDYTDGKEYYCNISGFSEGSYSFHFAANDSIGDWTESNTLLFDVFGNEPMLSFGQIDPPLGDMDTWFNFTVVYVHLDNLAPDIICLNITGVGIYAPNEVDPLDIDYSDGKDYYYNLTGFNIGQYSFNFAASDTIGNWNESEILQFDVINRGPTLSFGQVTPENGYIDTDFNFTVTYTDLDNHIPGTVTLNVTGLGVYSLLEINSLDTDFADGKDYYLNLSGFALGTYNFHFATNDSFGVWTETEVFQFEVINRAPVLSLEHVDPIIGYVDSWYNFTVRYTDLDNHPPNIITVNISGMGVYDLLEVDIFDTDYTDGKEYSINLSGFSIGSYSFHFAANDTVGNWIETGVLQFYVINRDPVLSNARVNPSIGYIDTWFNFTVTYTDLDNHAPDSINVNITGVGVYDLMEVNSFDTSYSDGKEYYYNMSGFALGSYSFNFAANDTIGNRTMSGILMFNVINRGPVLSFGQINPSIGNIDTWFNFSVIYTDLDNHAPASIMVNITGLGVYELLEVNNLDIDHMNGKEYYLNITGFDVGQYSLHFAAEDIIGYWDESIIFQFVVLNRAPTLAMENVTPIIGTYGTAFNFTVHYTDLDNHAPDVINLNITGLGIIDMFEANSSDTNYVDGKEYYYAIILNAGTYSFHFAANDSLGMWALETPEINAPEVQPKHCSLYAIDSLEIYANDIQLNARLLDDDFNPIQGQSVAFYIDINKNGIYESGELIDEDTTLSEGGIFVIFTTDLPVGNYNFTVIYTGSGNYFVEDDEAILTIDPKAATLTANINVVEVGETTTLNATLIDDDNNPIENVQIIFYLDKNKNGIYEGSEFIVSTTTSIEGVASINYYVNLTPENYGFWAKYAGSGNYYVQEIQGLLTVRDTGNKPPMILWTVPNQIKSEDSPPWTLNLSSYEADVEDYGPDLKWYLTGIDTGIYSVTGMNSSNDILRFIPVENAYGNDEVVLWLADSSGAVASQILWINITPVNDLPYFSPLPPDLYVHYDDPSTSEDDPVPWDYKFYVHDVETPIENLILTTSEPSVDSGRGYTEVDGLKIAYHYPHSRIGESILVSLRLSDGTDITQTVIMVNVTSNWVPELINKLPDIVIEENTTLYSVFDLDDYFIDKDMDSLFFSSGYFHIIITINENNSVDITAQENWAGTEYVTFRAKDPTNAIAEDTINVTVIPINDGPTISGVPNLVVHFDYSYPFDLSPYIFDSDNLTTELLVWTSESTNYIWLQQYNNLGLVVNYPEFMNGTTFPVTIYVSDGLKMAYQTINVTVTDNFPPELKYELPDVVFDEDTTLIRAFILSDHFFDIDSEVLYYTNGTRFINVTINDDLSVDFSAPENWYGSEIVTFRATDPIGALAEDKILVVVVPVNDAPTVGQIPRQDKKEGDQWILDLSPYIDDVDNDLSELTIIVENMVEGEYVILMGNILVFQYPEGIKEDMITITISDGEFEASRSFVVNLRTSEPVAVSIWDLIPWGWVFLITFFVLGGAFAFYKKKSRYSVIEAFLIHKNGLPIAHVSREEKSELEEVVVSGMFTAVQDFINDTFSDHESEDDWKLDEMKFGEHKILIERSQNLYLAAIFEGYSGKLKNRLKKVLGDISEKYDTIFENWDGDMEQLIGLKGIMMGLIFKKAKNRELEESSMEEDNVLEVKEEKLYAALEEVEKDFLNIVCEEKVKIANEEGFEVVEIEVFDCPVCGKEIEGRLDKCPRCGVEFVDIEDMGSRNA